MLAVESDGELVCVDGGIFVMRTNCIIYVQIFSSLKEKKKIVAGKK